MTDHWVCRCDCGGEITVAGDDLRSGRVRAWEVCTVVDEFMEEHEIESFHRDHVRRFVDDLISGKATVSCTWQYDLHSWMRENYSNLLETLPKENDTRAVRAKPPGPAARGAREETENDHR